MIVYVRWHHDKAFGTRNNTSVYLSNLLYCCATRDSGAGATHEGRIGESVWRRNGQRTTPPLTLCEELFMTRAQRFDFFALVIADFLLFLVITFLFPRKND